MNKKFVIKAFGELLFRVSVDIKMLARILGVQETRLKETAKTFDQKLYQRF